MIRKWIPMVLLVFMIFLCASQASAKTLVFNKKNFPDKAMRDIFFDEYVLGDKITKSDLNGKDFLDIDGGKRKVNLKGIEYFSKLSNLVLYETAKSREFPKISKLEELEYYNDAIEKLKLPRYPKLAWVVFEGKKLESLDLSNNKQIRRLTLCAPKLQKLDVSSFSELAILELEKMNLPELDLSYNSELEEIELENINLPELDLSHNPELWNVSLKNAKGVTFDPAPLGKLKKLILSAQDMETFELSDHPALETLVIENDSKLQKVVIKGCKKLKKLTIKNNASLLEIQIEGCAELKELTVEKNPLLGQIQLGEEEKLTSLSVNECKKVTSLDPMNLSQLLKLQLVDTSVSEFSAKQFPKLETLSVYRNPIKKIDFPSFKNLESLEVRYDKSTKNLDVSKLSKLCKLTWTHGVLEKVNFGKNSRKMYYIDLNDNRLSGKWNMEAFKNLEALRLNNNRITSIDFGKRDQIESVFCRNNRLKTFKSVEALNLFELDCRDNPGVQIYMCHSDDECMDWRFGKKSKVYYKYG